MEHSRMLCARCGAAYNLNLKDQARSNCVDCGCREILIKAAGEMYHVANKYNITFNWAELSIEVGNGIMYALGEYSWFSLPKDEFIRRIHSSIYTEEHIPF